MSPASRGERRETTGVHAQRQDDSEQDGTKVSDCGVSIEDGEPERNYEEETGPGIAGAPRYEAEEMIQWDEEGMRVCEGACYLRWC